MGFFQKPKVFVMTGGGGGSLKLSSMIEPPNNANFFYIIIRSHFDSPPGNIKVVKRGSTHLSMIF